MLNNVIPIFYACDEEFAKYCAVSLKSMILNSSKSRFYKAHILYTDISEETKNAISDLGRDNFKISFIDVSGRIDSIESKLPIRDYYSKTTYYRFFISDLFPEYEKAIYIDSDTVVQSDIAELYDTEIGDLLLGACPEQVMIQTKEYGDYAEGCVGVPRHEFFNAGVLLINCKLFRERSVLDKFTELLSTYDFRVTQDEDYLNVICKDRVFFLDGRWNTEIYGKIPHPIEEARIIHYIMASKPWHYEDCPFCDIFWKYAETTDFFEDIKAELSAYTDKEKERDRANAENLLKLAAEETLRCDNYRKKHDESYRAKDRVLVLSKIAEYEKEGKFDIDAENDPPTKPLLPSEINYLKKGLLKRIKTEIAYAAARKKVHSLIQSKELIIKDVVGLESLKNLKSGAVITCNHFNAFDSFAMQIAYEASGKPKNKFYRVIREGNYTSFPGFYGFLMRNCNTLPLSSCKETMKKFIEAADTLLKKGNYILFYPEQSMWWNYRKPKPLKPGAFHFASKNNVPVLPVFITMRDSEILGDDGFYTQEYTIHISEPIYPDTALSLREDTERMMRKNYLVWKQIYESAYRIPLVYSTEDKKA